MPQVRGMGDFVPAKRGRVELGASSTGTATFVIDFEEVSERAQDTPIYTVYPAYTRLFLL